MVLLVLCYLSQILVSLRAGTLAETKYFCKALNMLKEWEV